MNMLRKFLIVFLLFVSASSSLAQSNVHVDVGGGTINGVAPIFFYKSAGAGQFGLSVATLTSLTPPASATVAQICVGATAINYRDDGTAPTASVGMPLPAGSCFQYAGPLASIQFITVGGAATINVLYYAAK